MVNNSESNSHSSIAELDGIRITLLLIGIILVGMGQFLSKGPHLGSSWGPSIILGLGILAFVLAAQSFVRKKFNLSLMDMIQRLSNWFGLRPFQILLVCSAPVISLVAWLAAGDLQVMFQPFLAIFSWLAAITVFIIGHLKKEPQRSNDKWQQQDTYITVLLFVLSLLLRGLLLDEIPWMLTGDEGSAGLTAVEFIQGSRDNPFVTGWFSFPSLFFWVQSLSIKLFGQTTVGLRVPSMIAGALTVPALYWFIRSFFGRKMAIGSAAYLAVFHFHIHFSRIGLNNIWDGLFVVLFIGFFWRAWTAVEYSRPRTSLNFALAGITLGLSQYFYTSVRALAGIFVLFVILMFIQDRRAVKDRLAGFSSTCLGFIVVMLPLAGFYIAHPDQFVAPFARVTHLGPWLQEEIALTGQSAIIILATKFKQAALAFTHVDLRSWYKPDEPMLLAVPSALFILGLIILLFKIREPIFQWLILWLVSAITISALSESTPAAQRLTFAAPVVAILVVLPLSTISDWLSKSVSQRNKLIEFGLAAILVVSILGDISFYFGSFSLSQKFGDTNTEVAQGVANYLNSIEGTPTVYFVGLPRMGYYTHSSIRYLAPHASGEDIPDPLMEPPTNVVDGEVVYVFLPERIDELSIVKSAFPDGEERRFISRNNEPLFTIYSFSSSNH